MGPRSDNRGYASDHALVRLASIGGPSMGPRSDNRGYAASSAAKEASEHAKPSMGPRSDNRGYGLALESLEYMPLTYSHARGPVTHVCHSDVEAGALVLTS